MVPIGRLRNLLFPKRPETPETLGGYPLARGERGGASAPAAPTLVSAIVQPTGTTLRLTFSVAMTGLTTGAEGFVVSGITGGGVSLTYASGNGTTVVDFTTSRTIGTGDSGALLAYTAGDVVALVGGAALANFTNFAVTNTSTMSPAVRNVTTGTTSFGTTTVTLPTRSSGDTLVVVVASSMAFPAANTGWTIRQDQQSVDLINRIGVYTRQSDGTDNTPFGANAGADILYTAFSISTPLSGHELSNGNSNVPSTSIQASGLVLNGVRDVLICGYLRCANSGTITVPGGQTPTTTVVTALLTFRCGYETLAAGGSTGTRTATQSDSQNWAASTTAVR